MSAPRLGQLLGEGCMHTLRAVNLHASRIGEKIVHPGRAKLATIRAEMTGYEPHPTTIGRALQRLCNAGIVERISHGGRYVDANGKPGRKANVYRLLNRAKRALYAKGDWADAIAVAAVCPPRNVARFAGVLARRAAAAAYQKECDAVKPGTALGDAIAAAKRAARVRVVEVERDDVIEGVIADELEIVAALQDFDAMGSKMPAGEDSRFPVPALPAAAPPLIEPPPLPPDAFDDDRPREVADIIHRQRLKLANKPPT